MTVSRRLPAFPMSALGYALLLMAFVMLGLFVAALATGISGLAIVLGIGLIGCLAGSVTGFVAASRKLAKAGVTAEATSPVSIFSTPLHQHQIDRYLENYRGENRSVARATTMTVLVGDEATRPTKTERTEHMLLSA